MTIESVNKPHEGGLYLVVADGIHTMLRWDGEHWAELRGILPLFKEVLWSEDSYCGHDNPIFRMKVDEVFAKLKGKNA